LPLIRQKSSGRARTKFDPSGPSAFAGSAGEVEIRFVFYLAAHTAAMALLGGHRVQVVRIDSGGLLQRMWIVVELFVL